MDRRRSLPHSACRPLFLVFVAIALLALPALARAEQGDWYLSTLLGVEAWLRALEPGGQMARLIPARAPSGSRGAEKTGVGQP